MSVYLQEHLTFNQAHLQIISEDGANNEKNLYMKGICIEGDVRNANGRIYPVNEIGKAVDSINEQLEKGNSILGEVDHPDDLKINLDRVSHMIMKMWMDGSRGLGKLKIIPTTMGKLVQTMLENGVKLGVSSRGSGNVNENNGHVSDFELVTIDIVAMPSAPNAYPKAIYESLLNHPNGMYLYEMLKDPANTSKAQRYIKSEILKFINTLQL